MINQFPHCDGAVLHAPSKCKYCDMHPDWQELREVWNINFTGEHDTSKTICPAEAKRPLDSINKWDGNVAFDEEAEKKQKAWFEKLDEIIKDFRNRIPDYAPYHTTGNKDGKNNSTD